MNNFISKMCGFAIALILILSLSINVMAYTGLLDSYSGWCGSSGIRTSDTWYNDDGIFYAQHYITGSAGGSGGLMQIIAQKWHWFYGWQTQLTRTITRDVGYYQLDFPVANGEYSFIFKTINNPDLRIDFNGNVYDTN